MKLKPTRYAPFCIVEQRDKSTFNLDLPPYLKLVFNVDRLKLFQLSSRDLLEGDPSLKVGK